MSQRPAYNLINQLIHLKLSKHEAQEFNNDFEQVKESLTIGLSSIGELMAIASSEDNEAGVTPNTLVNASWLITTLCDFIQACDEQHVDCLNYLKGDFSQRGVKEQRLKEHLIPLKFHADRSFCNIAEDSNLKGEALAISKYINGLEEELASNKTTYKDSSIPT
jgi:hypothetical protein